MTFVVTFERFIFAEMHERAAAGHRARRQADCYLRGRGRGNESLRRPGSRNTENRRLLAGNSHRHSHATVVVPHRGFARLQRRLSEKFGEVRYGRVKELIDVRIFSRDR